MVVITVAFLMLLSWINGLNSNLLVRQTVLGSSSESDIVFNVSMEHLLTSDNRSYNVMLTSNATKFTVEPSSVVASPEDKNKSFIQISNEESLRWNYSELTNGEMAYVSYKVNPPLNSQGNYDLPLGKSFHDASLAYSVQPPINGTSDFGPFVSLFCIERIDDQSKEMDFDERLIALTVIVGTFAGAVLVLLILFGLYFLTKRNPIFESATGNLRVCKRQKKLPKEISNGAVKPLFMWKLDGSSGKETLPWTDTIITILRMPERNNIMRQIERLDIEDTARVCGDLDQQRDEAIMNLAINFIKNYDPGANSKNVRSKCTMSLLEKRKFVEKKMEFEFEQCLLKEKTSRNEVNRKRLEALTAKHDEEMNFLMEHLRQRNSQEEFKSVRKLMVEKQQLEIKSLQYRIDLETMEYTEKMSSEFLVENEIVRRGLLLDFLRDVTKTGSLPLEQLVKDYDQLEVVVRKLSKEAETSRIQALEEKLAKRKCLLKTQELARSLSTELLNAVTSQLLQLVTFAKKSGKLPQSSARRVKEDVIAEAEDIKSRGEEEMEKREIELLKKLSTVKRNRFSEEIKRHELQLDEIRRREKLSHVTDFLHFLEIMQTCNTQWQQEMAALEIKMDSDHAHDLLRLREMIQDEMKQELSKSKEILIKDLKEIGVQSMKMKPLLERHEEELKELKHVHQKETKEKLNNFKKSLSDGSFYSTGGLQHKSQPQDQLSHYKQTVVRNLINSQMALSSESREELQTDLVKDNNYLVSSLRTSEKLRHHRIMEESQAIQEKDLLGKLDQELRLKLRSFEKQRSDDSEDDYMESSDISVIASLFENYYKQSITILKGEEIISQEEEVMKNLNKEQAKKLKEEEDQKAVLLIKIQMKKFKELFMLENQRRFLHDITCGLMKQLVESSVLTVMDCRKLLQIHEKELKSISVHLNDDTKIGSFSDSKRKHLEKTLKQSEDNTFDQLGEQRNPFAAKLEKILALEKQILDQNFMQIQLEREIRQEIEELKRSGQVNLTWHILEKELELFATVIKAAGYTFEDMESTLRSNLPHSVFVKWKYFLYHYQTSDWPASSNGKRNLKKCFGTANEANQNITMSKADKVDVTSSRLLLKLGKLHPLPSSVSPVSAYEDLDILTHSLPLEIQANQKPSNSNKNQLSHAQTTPSRLPPIIPPVGSKQKKSVRLVEPPNEYWSG